MVWNSGLADGPRRAVRSPVGADGVGTTERRFPVVVHLRQSRPGPHRSVAAGSDGLQYCGS